MSKVADVTSLGVRVPLCRPLRTGFCSYAGMFYVLYITSVVSRVICFLFSISMRAVGGCCDPVGSVRRVSGVLAFQLFIHCIVPLSLL